MNVELSVDSAIIIPEPDPPSNPDKAPKDGLKAMNQGLRGSRSGLTAVNAAVPATVHAAPGQKVRCSVVVPNTNGYTFPAVLINGRTDGEIMLVTAGVHGAEYPGIQALIELSSEINPEQVRGAILFIPIVNTPAFYQRRAYVCPADEENKNFNRIFPGNPNGTVADKVAAFITEQFVSRCSFHVDLHSGDIVENLDEFCIVANAGCPDLLARITQAAQHTCFPCRINSRGTVEAYNRSAIDYHIPALLFERGQAGLLRRQDVERDKSDVLNLMRFLNILPGQAVDYSDSQKFYARHTWLSAGHTGCFYRYVDIGDRVQVGQLLGEIRDVSGNLLEQFRAEYEGLVRIAVNTLGISAGDDTFMYVG